MSSMNTVIELDQLTPVPLESESHIGESSAQGARSSPSVRRWQTTLMKRNLRSKSILCRVPFSQSPYISAPLSVDTKQQPPRRSSVNNDDEARSSPLTSTSQTTLTNWAASTSTLLYPSNTPSHPSPSEELFLHVTPLSHETPADAIKRPYCLSPRDIDTIAYHLTLSREQRQNIPRTCCPVTLQHHIQTELMRRVHLGIDIGGPHRHASCHRRFALSDSPFTFEIRGQCNSKEIDEKNSNGGQKKYAFKKPIADLSDQLAHDNDKKSATWMELFLDLTFVANITIFTHQHPITDTTTMFRYCGWFTILWWMWISQTMFDVRFSTDDLLNRIWKLIQLFALAGFAGNGDHFTSTNSNGFALSYAVMKLVLVGQYFVVWLHAPDQRSRRPILFYMLANSVSFVMWWTSAFLIQVLSDQARYAIWFGAIAIEVVTNVALANEATVTFIGSHLPERLGLFTLIILGESIMGLFMLTDELVDAPSKLGWDNLTLLIFSITVVKCQWFLYFDDYHDQGPVRSSIHSTLWTYLHFMLNLSQLLLGVGCLDLIRIYQLAKDTSLFPDEPEEAKYPDEAAGGGGLTSALSPSAFPDILRDDRRELGPHHDLVLIYVKKYFLIVAANVFLWNAAIKYVTSRPGDKYDRAIYVSRFFMSFVVLCLLLVEHHQLGAFSLLGLEVGFCLLQVGHDLLVLYYAARKDIDTQCGPC